MKSAKIIVAPHPTLRLKAKTIEKSDKKIAELAKTLNQTLEATNNPPGVGLAAPQIDSSWRMFATQLESHLSDELVRRVFLNPRIVDQSDRQVLGVHPREPDMEGCLSIPFLYGPVLRPEWLTIEFQQIDPDGQLSHVHSETFFDFAARVVAHEIDHLDGVLFTDHILSQGQPLYQEEKRKLIEIDPQIARSL